jgi:high-affinity nickel permease
MIILFSYYDNNRKKGYSGSYEVSAEFEQKQSARLLEEELLRFLKAKNIDANNLTSFYPLFKKLKERERWRMYIVGFISGLRFSSNPIDRLIEAHSYRD